MSQIVEYLGLASGVIYVLCEIKQYRAMWIVGIVTAVAYIIVYAQNGIYASMSYQIYYLVVSLYGLWRWHSDKKFLEELGTATTEICYRRIGTRAALLSLAIFAGIFLVVQFVLNRATDDPVPAVDAIVTSLSIIATWWLGKSYLEQWILWIVADLLTMGFCLSLGLYPSALLNLLYTFSAIYGLYHWHKRGVLLK